MQGRKVLVTGAGGFIGSHLVEALVRRGADVQALVHYNAIGSSGNLAFLPDEVLAKVRVVKGDLIDAEFLKRIIADRDYVFHLGALIAIPHSYKAPRSFVETNVVGTFNILEGVRANGKARLIHTSTSEVYGSARYVPIDEAHPLQAQSPYAASKIGADKLVESYHASFDVDCVTVRPFNTYGPRQSPRAVIPTVIGQALAGRPAIRLGALTPVRDMTFVLDTVDGFIRAAETPGLEGGVFNLGTGEGESIKAIAERILRIMEVDAGIEVDPDRLRPERSEVDRLISENGAFANAAGWKPRTGLDEGLRQTVAFFRRYPDLLPAEDYAT